MHTINTDIKTLHRLLVRVVLTLMLCFVSGPLLSCSSEDQPEESPCVSVNSYRAGLYITLEDGAVSRAPSVGDYEAGTRDENYIDIEGGDFRLLLFDRNDIYLGAIDNPVVTPENIDGNLKTYFVSGEIAAAIVTEANQELKVMMLANWRNNYTTPVKGETTVSDIASASRYEFDFSAPISESNPIPMFGISNLLTGLNFTTNWTTDLGTIHLLRAYAKVRVHAAPGSHAIKSIKLTNANAAGMYAPADVSVQTDYVHTSYDKDYTRTASIPADRKPVTDVELTADDNGLFTIYVPEYINTTGTQIKYPILETDRCRLEVMFEGDENKVYYVDFKYYNAPPAYAPSASQGDHFDILRNTVYDFTIVKNDLNLEIEVDIQPYAEIKLNPWFGLERDPDGNIITEWCADGSYKVLIDGSLVQKDADGDQIVKTFSDGSVLCRETVYKDYIHDDNKEVDYEYIFEKDAPGGHMVILREKSTGSTHNTGDDTTIDNHDHDTNDRPLFVIGPAGLFYRVVYGEGNKKTLLRTDILGDTILQANGFQYRNSDDMTKYLGTYIAKKSDGTEELRYYKDGRTLTWADGINSIPADSRADLPSKYK